MSVALRERLVRGLAAGWRPLLLIGAIALVWAVVRPYRGLDHDGQLYAFQALARLRPDLFANDLFVRFGSQDDYTVFSRLGAFVMARIGVEHGAAVITFCCYWLLMLAASLLAKRLYGREAAWLSAALLVALPGFYGGYEVFRVAEIFLSARPLAQALALLGLVGVLSGHRLAGVLTASLAFSVHPLMALPGWLATVAMAVPRQAAPGMVVVAALAFVATLLVAALAPFGPLAPLDPQWLDIVHQRSVYLFVREWPFEAWQVIGLVAATLLIGADAAPDRRGRDLMRWSLAIGAAGIVIAAIASDTFPVQILLQGQAWRWLWLPTVIAIVSLGDLLPRLGRSGHAQRAAAALLLTGWILPWSSGLALGLAAWACWHWRERMDGAHPRLMRALWVSVLAAVSCWTLATGILVASGSPGLGAEPLWVERLRDVAGLVVPGVALVLAGWIVASHPQQRLGLTAVVAVATVVGLAGVGPRAVDAWTGQRYLDRRPQFAGFRTHVPPRTEILWLTDPVSAWLLVERPNYLSQSQLAGIVFSRATALEGARRAAAIDAYADRDWILALRAGSGRPVRPLTIGILDALCADPTLGFVVDKQDLGIAVAFVRDERTATSDYLYDCAKQRAQSIASIHGDVAAGGDNSRP